MYPFIRDVESKYNDQIRVDVVIKEISKRCFHEQLEMAEEIFIYKASNYLLKLSERDAEIFKQAVKSINYIDLEKQERIKTNLNWLLFFRDSEKHNQHEVKLYDYRCDLYDVIQNSEYKQSYEDYIDEQLSYIE